VEGEVFEGDAEFGLGAALVDVLAAGAGGACVGEAEGGARDGDARREFGAAGEVWRGFGGIVRVRHAGRVVSGGRAGAQGPARKEARVRKLARTVACVAGMAGVCAGARGEDVALYKPAEALAVAQDAEGGAPVEAWRPKAWTVQVAPLVWFPGARADVRLPGGSAEAQTEDLELDDPEATAGGELRIRSDELTVYFAGFGYGGDVTATLDDPVSVGGLSFAPGDRVRSELDYASVELWAGWCVFEKVFEGATRTEPGVGLRVDVTGGVRLYDVGLEIGAADGGASAKADETWVEPTVGVVLTFELLDDFTIDLVGNVGALPLGDRSSFSASIATSGQWRIVENVGLELGYRFLYTDLEADDGDEEFGFTGSLAGLFGALVIRF
jgi:hypothetical protein